MHVDKSVPDTIDAHHKRLVVYSFHGAFRHKSAVSHGRAQVILEKAQTGSWGGDTDGDTRFWRTIILLIDRTTWVVGGHLQPRFRCGCPQRLPRSGTVKPQTSLSWKAIETEFPLRWYSCFGIAFDESCSEYAVSRHASEQ